MELIMTDMTNDTAQSLDNTNNVQNSAASEVIATPETVPQEKMLAQSEVNELVGKIKKDTYEKARRDFDFTAQKAAQVQQISVPQQNIGDYPISDDHIRQLITEQAQQAFMQAQAERVAHEFNNKMLAARERYPDFDEVTSDLEYGKMASIVQMANGFDNTADIMYDLSKNPSKFSDVFVWSATNPKLAERELRKLSESIKRNQEAAKLPAASQPLSQIKPSITGTDNGSKTVQDLRKESWLRG